MILPILSILKTVPILPLLGQSRTLVERTLGKGTPVQGSDNLPPDIVDGVPRTLLAYAGITVTYVGDRVLTVQRDFGKAPGLTWQAALASCAVSSKGVVATPDGGTLNLSGGALPPWSFVTYTGAKATISERSLVVRAPYSFVFSPTPAERKAVLDRFRPEVESALSGQRIKFVVDSIAMKSGWAFLSARPLHIDGSPIDFHRSKFAEAAKAGMVDDGVVALLRKRNGRWRVVDRALFPTDVPWEPWAAKYGAPKAIFPNYAPR